MKSTEKYISQRSDYYIYTPSVNIPPFLFFCNSAGHFFYKKKYHLVRDSYDSFLLFYVCSGSMNFRMSGDSEVTVRTGECLFMDCHKAHEYNASEDCECFWCHFDGGAAAEIYKNVSVFSPFPLITADNHVSDYLIRIFMSLEASSVSEPGISDLINRILTTFLEGVSSEAHSSHPTVVSDAMSYIGAHFSEDLSIDDLAKEYGVSVWHFIRLFSRECGCTPHEYLVRVRMNTARFMLKTTTMSVKEICFACGYSAVSIFCTAFKRETGKTPVEYRQGGG